MKITKSQLRIIDRIRHAQRWRVASVWVVGTASAIFCVLALLMFLLLIAHLHEHGVRLSNLFKVLQESQHPTHLPVLTVFTAGMSVVIFLMTAIQLAFGVIIVLLRGREQKLLIELFEDYTKRELKGADKKESKLGRR